MAQTTEVFALESSDFLEMEDALSTWDQRYLQLSRGEFTGRLLHAQMGSIGIFHNYWGQSILYQGTAPQNAFGIAISLAQSEEGYWLGQPTGIDDVVVQRCGADAEYISAREWNSLVFVIPQDDLKWRLEQICPHAMIKLLKTHGVIRLHATVAVELRQACRHYLKVAEHALSPHGATQPLSATSETLVNLLISALAYSVPTPLEKASTCRQRKLVSRAEDFIEAYPTQPLSIAHLCSVLNVSERTLRHAFYKTTNKSPLNYLKCKKLNRVYRHLQKIDSSKLLIKQVAMENGFLHLGQFSQDYRLLFGQLPSESLQADKSQGY